MLNEEDFKKALSVILRLEGGASDHPADAGGATNLGITQKIFDAYCRRKGLPLSSVSKITVDSLLDIYRTEFWEPAGCPLLPWRIALVHFDTAVQRGPVKANRMLQQVIGAKVDGIIGPKTLELIGICDEECVVQVYLRDRERQYTARVEEDESQKVFLKGWMNRLSAVRQEVEVG